MAKKKKGQPQSAIPFFMMAGFAFLAGFPIWLVLVLALMGALVLKLEKDKKALSNLPPLPPAETDGASSSIEDSSTPAAGPFGKTPEQSAPMPTAPLPQSSRVPPAPTYEEPTEAPELPPWASPDYQPYQAPAHVAPPKIAPVVPATKASQAATSSRARVHPMARNLRSRQGARQAIIAMTVLGAPRALQPYEFDPIQQSDVAPGRPS